MSERDTLEQALDLHEIGLNGALAHVSIGDDLGRAERAHDLRRAGLVIIEYGPDGFIVTRTWRGSQALKAIKAAQRVFAGSL